MTNDVHNIHYLTIEDYDVLICFIKTENIHIENLNWEVYAIFTLCRAYFPWPFNTVKC